MPSLNPSLNPNPMSDPIMSNTAAPAFPTTLTLAEKVHRPLNEIQADIDKAEAEFLRLEPLVRDDNIRVNKLIVNWQRAVDEHNKRNPGEEFDPGRYYLPPTKPAARDDLQRELWNAINAVDRVKKEMELAKKAAYAI